MINQLKALSLAAVATVAAVSTSPAATTNILQNVSIQFTFYSQGGITTNKHTGLGSSVIVTNSMNTKEFIAALGTNITGKALPSGSTLGIATPIGGSPSIVIIDSTNLYTIPTNIIPSFYYTGAPVGNQTFSTNGTLLSESPEILAATQTIDIPGTLDVTLSGVAIIKTTGIVTGKGTNEVVTGVYNSDLSLAGSGTLGTTPVIVTGSLTETTGKILVVK